MYCVLMCKQRTLSVVFGTLIALIPAPPGASAQDAASVDPVSEIMSSIVAGNDFSISDDQIESELYLEEQICFSAAAETTFAKVIDENFVDESDSEKCASKDVHWDSVLGAVEKYSGSCRLKYHLAKGKDEQAPGKVETSAKLAKLTSVPVQGHLKVEWTEHFAAGYEFPDGSQKLARFFVSAGGGHEANVVIMEGGISVQGSMFVRALDGKGKPVLLEIADSIKFEKGVPTKKDIPFSLEVQMPTTDADGWMEFSVDGQKKKKPMPKVRKLSDKCVAGFDGVWVGGNWSNAGTVTKKESDRYISAVRIYGEIKKEEGNHSPS